MNPSISLFIIIIFSILIPATAQETLSSVQRELDRVDREIEREKKLHKLEKKKVSDFEKKKKQKLAAVNKQSKVLDGKTAELQAEVARLKKQKRRLKGQIKSYGNKRKAITSHLQKSIQDLMAFFQSDFPYQQDKNISDLERLHSDLSEDVIGPEEGMNRLFTLLRSSISLGYDTEVYSGTYKAGNGSEYEGKYLRLGAVIQVFVSLDGNKVAYLTRGDSTYSWVDEDLELELRQNIKKAVKVAEGKTAPELVLLPFGKVRHLKPKED